MNLQTPSLDLIYSYEYNTLEDINISKFWIFLLIITTLLILYLILIFLAYNMEFFI